MSKTASKLKVASCKGAVLAVALGALMVSGCAVRSGKAVRFSSVEQSAGTAVR